MLKTKQAETTKTAPVAEPTVQAIQAKPVASLTAEEREVVAAWDAVAEFEKYFPYNTEAKLAAQKRLEDAKAALVAKPAVVVKTKTV